MEPQQNEGGGGDSSGLSIVVPAYNEARRLPGTLPRVIEYVVGLDEPAEIIVVDDGSTDGTAEVATAAAKPGDPVVVLRSRPNRGKGAAVRRGVLAARFGHVLFTDVDLSTPIEETAKLRAALARGADVAIGSRYADGAEVAKTQPLYRRLWSRLCNRVVQKTLVPGIHDSQCGFKVFRRSTARELFGRQRLDGFGFDAEVLWLARRLGYQVAEVPIVWRDDSRSNVRLMRDSGGMLLDLGRVHLNGWMGRYALRRPRPAPSRR